RNNAQTEGHFNNAILTMGYLSSPLTPVKQPDGSYTPHVTSTDLFDNANPVNMIVNRENRTHVTQLLSNAYVDIEPVKGLHLKSTFNAEIQNTNNYQYVPSYVGGFRAPPPQPASGSYGSAYEINWLNENTLTYDHSFGPHALSLLLGYTVQKDHQDENNTGGSSYPNDDLHDLGAATIFSANTNIQEWTLISYLGRLNYNYKDKYLISAALRSDGSSRFGPENRWSLFPSVSAGWRVSNEGFFPKGGFFSDLKLRASYGVAGNNNIGNYRYIPTISSADYQFNNNFISGTALSSLANNQLGWELSRQADGGLDITMLDGRLSLTVDYYLKHTEDMLQSIAIPSSSGYTGAYTNLGNVENHGWEFAIHSVNMNGAVHWQTDFNISFNRNKVLKLGGGITQILSGDVNTNVTEVGQPIGMFYGYEFLGIFQSDDEIEKYPHQPGTLPGNVKYKDFNGDGQITSADMTIIGNPFPKFTWGMTNALSYKNFDLRIILEGSQGARVMDLYKRFMDNLDGVFNVEKAVQNRWRSAAQPGNGQYASTTGKTALAREVNSRWVKNASYVCLRNITLGYAIKTKLVSEARVYVSGQNLLWLSSYKGSDPDIEYNADNSLAPNVNYTGYPTATMITAGIDFTF
ncbi:MAG TPA: SusC/RagA family TonB-linked outer membrane protein, partial [Chitinophagaceae bacterium]|nr:SusC/RagA family TonB-linked outer membrane protein [Chitinophagaceae bacterium]